MFFKEKHITDSSFLKNDPYWASISRSNAIIEFTPDGLILSANENFLKTTGYTLEEIIGQHHTIFCPIEVINDPKYLSFWKDLSNGEFFSKTFPRLTKDNHLIWLEATYNPVFKNNKVVKIIKIAKDVTEKINFSNSNIFMVNAINRSLAIIEFDIHGHILTANENFSKTMGYSIREIQGKHHRLFCNYQYTQTLEYSHFWKDLSNGKFHSGKYERYAKNGSVVWLEATYNPVFDDNGYIIKIIKIAKDITKEINNVIKDEHNADLVYKISHQATEISLSNKLSMNVANSNAQEIQSLMLEAENMVNHLSKSVQDINELVEKIKHISHQTHLLSINASIEAANAGVHGKGFSVVAQEVKRLSNITKSSSDEISSYILNIKEATSKTKEKILSCSNKSIITADKTNNAYEGLIQIEHKLNSLLSTVEKFSSIKH